MKRFVLGFMAGVAATMWAIGRSMATAEEKRPVAVVKMEDATSVWTFEASKITREDKGKR